MRNQYPRDTVGYRMIKKEKLPVFLVDEEISKVRETYFQNLNQYEVAYYLYFVNKKGELVGVMSQREVFEAEDSIPAKNLIRRKIEKVGPFCDQEEVAILAIKSGLKAIPVVDKENKFLGVVSARQIFNILRSEHTDDLLKTAGIHSEPAKALDASVSHLIKARIPWLILGIFGGTFAARLTEFFERPLKEYFVLAAFIPLIVYLADAIGTQTEALLIRNLALRKINLKDYISKELKIGSGIALILGVLVFLISYLWLKVFYISLILGVSIFFTGIVGTFLPILFVRLLIFLKKDPAFASGPLATICQDIVSLAIYFLIASLLLRVLA